MSTVEQRLTEAFAPHGVKVRACRASFHAQAWFGASNRIKNFYVRFNEPRRNIYHVPPYKVSNKEPWPTHAQLDDEEWLEALVQRLTEQVIP